MVLIEDLRAQIEDTQFQMNEEDVKQLQNQNLLQLPPPNSAVKEPKKSVPQTPDLSSSKKNSDRQQLSPNSARMSESVQLEVEFMRKDYEEVVKKIKNDHEMVIAVERVNHKNQIEKYNSNLEILSGKIQALVIVNEKLSKELEVMKMEFTNYRIIAWSVLQEMRKSLDNFRKYDEDIMKQMECVGGNVEELEKLKEVYTVMKNDILYVDKLIEDRRKLI